MVWGQDAGNRHRERVGASDRVASTFVLPQELLTMNESEVPAGRTPVHKVVVNHEGQYSLWFVDRDNPPGWTDAGKQGSKEECLAYVEEVWTDMRPLSLRTRMGEPA